jgi:hypothetical protein
MADQPYIIVEAHDLATLEVRVTRYVGMDYAPVGGITIHSGGLPLYIQVVVKKEVLAHDNKG